MKVLTDFKLTREKHLDHMVKVVPFIVMCYAIQCFVILKIDSSIFSTTSLSFLGGMLVLMIAGFITYDLKQTVSFGQEYISGEFLGLKHTIYYHDITSVEVKDPKESFTSLVIKTHKKKYTYFFVDDAEKIQAWIETKRFPTDHKMAA